MSNEKPLRLLDRLAALLHDKPDTREELVAVLRDAHTRNLIDSDRSEERRVGKEC